MLMDKEVTQITKEALIAISKYMLILIIFFYSNPSAVLASSSVHA